MELLCSTNQDADNSNDSGEPPNDNGPSSNMPQGPLSGSSGGDHDDHDSPIGPYLTPSESKLFATAAGSFNFSMAALAADPAALGGLNQSLQSNADTLAGTSQGVDDFRCQPCNKSLSSLTRLKRHIQNVHMRPSREPVCNICKRVYSSLNSLRNHKTTYRRNRWNLNPAPYYAPRQLTPTLPPPKTIDNSETVKSKIVNNKCDDRSMVSDDRNCEIPPVNSEVCRNTFPDTSQLDAITEETAKLNKDHGH
ncbi:hypothetical protein RN001_013165 [Aquatica leii]|uniref:C2H2-type domain-containing protein n=1 Tax=Aquatica leii TaxID=1421715 RepID=A0AAN7NW34_9COLE|nr:hypothetical protein RN001_013165 [Aquatica leii]